MSKVYVLEVEIPAIYTADIDRLREFKGEQMSESEFLLNVIGEPSVCRLRTEVSGEKDGSVEEVWGLIRGARLEDPTPGIDEDELAERGGYELMRELDACEWCQLREESDA